MKTVIMAGGRGTRMASVASGLPKPLIPLHNKPILQYQLECLAKNKLTDILVTVGYLADSIKNFCGDGSKFGCSISYYEETEPLGSGGALYKIMDNLDEDFILINGDLIFDIDFSRLINFHHNSSSWATLAVHPNNHPYDSALLVTDSEHRVTKWLNKEDTRLYHKNQVNAGIHILTKQLLKSIKPESEKVDLDREILKPLISTGKIFAYSTSEYIKEVGTPDRYEQVSLDIEKCLVQKRNLSNRQKAVFLDRDGTINIFNGFVTKPEEFTLIPGVSDAIRCINRSGFLAIVVTNQPVIARGDCSIEELETIHQKMESDLGKEGAYIDDLFYCPHHPDKGFPGERPEYKIDCNCRKPKPGMILAAAEKYNIDLASSYMVGDDMRDVEAGIAAGCIPVLLIQKPVQKELVKNGITVLQFPNLREFTDSCLS